MLNTKENGRHTIERKAINKITNMEIYKEEQKEIKKETVEQKECNELEGKQLEKVAGGFTKKQEVK